MVNAAVATHQKPVSPQNATNLLKPLLASRGEPSGKEEEGKRKKKMEDGPPIVEMWLHH